MVFAVMPRAGGHPSRLLRWPRAWFQGPWMLDRPHARV